MPHRPHMELPLSLRSPHPGGRKTPYKLEAKNLSYKLCSRIEAFNWAFLEGLRKPPKYILKGVTCEARPGEITAIAGPSGAGKTTLLEILAGKTPRGKVSGQVLVNDRPIDPNRFKRLSGYVSQEDTLFGSLTVEETLMYSALLRVHGGKKEVASRVKGLIKELGLEHVANTRVGTGSNRGISGGEKRRVSIGVELVHDPPVIIIDEPTSGLDSASALQMVKMLKFMAMHQGKTILLTIHQPGFRIVELFDRIILLSDGFVLHNGKLGLLEEKLVSSGLKIPNHVNVLEYAIDAIDNVKIQTLPNFEINSQRGDEDRKISSVMDNEKIHSYPNNRFEESYILGKRFCSNIFRTKQLFATRVIQSLVAGFILGSIFFNVGTEVGPSAVQTRLGFFAFSLTFLLSSTTEGLPIFLQERKILMRETSRGAYRVSSYVFSNAFVFIPFLLMVGVLYSVPVYYLIGLRNSVDGFLYFVLVVWLVLCTSNSFVACFSALVPNFIMGSSVIAGLIGAFFLFSGYFIAEDKIPVYWIFMHYLSLFKYPFECFLINEYGGAQGRTRCLQFVGDGGQCILDGGGFLKQQGFKETAKWTNVAVMSGFIVGYRVLCFLILWIRCYRTRN